MLVTRSQRGETRKMMALTAVMAFTKEYTRPEKKALRSIGREIRRKE